MKLSELVKAEVFDVNGEKVGRVHDARFVKDGPVQGAFGPAYRMEGLIVGAGAAGSRLGLDRTNVNGPYPLKKLFIWFHADAKFVDWAKVDVVEEGVIRLKAAKSDLPAVPPLPG